VVPGALPASLLERRPDVRQAEQNLIAANADIGVAKAAYFPRISLTALFGRESAELSDLFKGPSRTWSYGAGVTLPIFNAGRISNQVAQSEAVQRQALFAYQKSIIVAFQDVENALVDRTKFGRTREVQARNVAALQRFRDLAALRYKEGRPFTWKWPTPSSRCSTPSWHTSRRSPSCFGLTRTCTKRPVAAGSQRRRRSHPAGSLEC